MSEPGNPPAFWIVTSNGGCEACNALVGIHLTPPQRPHPHCRCTIRPVWSVTPGSSDGSGRCLYDEHLLLAKSTGGAGSQWNWDEEQYDHIQLTVHFVAMCKDGSIVEGTYTHVGDVDSDRFPFSGEHDLATWSDRIFDDAIARWEEEADALCPGCQ